MITNLRRQRFARTLPMQGTIGTRPTGVQGIGDAALGPARGADDELSRGISTLEVESLRLRQHLAEMTTSRDALRKEMDDLRRDRDHWRKLVERAEPKLEAARPKTWFCGRAAADA
jgi:hypothetical protein